MAKQTWLTCDFVEELQQAARVGGPVGDFVSLLNQATLPAIPECGCAMWHEPKLVPLSASILKSLLGRAIEAAQARRMFHEEPGHGGE